MLRLVSTLALAAALLCSPSARGELQRTGPEVWPSKHSFSAHTGYHLGFGGQVGDPSGMKLTVDYAYRFHRLAWFDVQVNQLFGFGARDGACRVNTAALCYRGGWSTQLAAGVAIKIPIQSVPLVVEIPLLLGATGMYSRECDDDGVAIPVARVGTGIKYFVRPRIGLGAVVHFDAGPAFHEGTSCKGGGRYTDFYGAFDFQIGAEFIL